MKTPWSDRVNELEKRWRGWGHKYFREVVSDKIVELIKPNKKILDVGCGAGILYNHLPPEIQQAYVGVDFTPEFIELCRTRYPQGKWRVEDARNFNLPDNSFYIVNTTNVLQHINDWKKAANELIRVSSKYIINICRIHNEKTVIVSMEPVLRRRFNPKDLIDFYAQYGKITWQWIRAASGRKTLGLFITELGA